MPSASEMERQEQEAQSLQSETETRRPMTGYEKYSDDRLIEVIFDPAHPTSNNFQLRRELRYRLIERGQAYEIPIAPRVMRIIDNGFGEAMQA